MNDWNSDTRIGPKPWNDGPARSREDHYRFFTEGLKGEPHANGCSTSSTGEMAMAKILRIRYFYFFHLSLTSLKIVKCKMKNENLKQRVLKTLKFAI
jgi:hypothetical protein